MKLPWKKQEKAQVQNPSKPTIAGFIGATVRSDEDGVLKYRSNANAVLGQYVSGIAADAGYFNANNLAAVPMRLYRVVNPNRTVVKAISMAERSGDIEEVVDHPVLDLLKDPADFTTASAWEVARWADKQFFGACYFLKATDEETGRLRLQRLMPQFLVAQPDKDGFITGYYYGRERSRQVSYSVDDILVLKMAEHPADPYRGLGWLELCIREIQIENEALSAELARWANGGYPSGILSFEDELDEEQMQEAQRLFEKYYGGAIKAGKTIITSRSTYTPLSTANDMNYQSGLDTIETRILNRAGIPEALYKLNDANLASSKTAHGAYARYTLTPMLSLDAEQWTQLLLPMFDLDPADYFFAYDEIIPEDKDSKRNDLIAYVQTDIMDKNEARAELDLPPREEKEETSDPIFFLPPADLLGDE